MFHSVYLYLPLSCQGSIDKLNRTVKILLIYIYIFIVKILSTHIVDDFSDIKKRVICSKLIQY